MLDEYVRYMRSVRGLSERTIESYRADVSGYLCFLESRGLLIDEADSKTGRAYVAELSRSRKNAASVNRKISALRSFYRYLLHNQLCIVNPFDSVSSLKRGRPLPEVFFPNELSQLLEDEPRGFSGFRDRLILEMLYSTGCRASELVGMNLGDIDRRERTILVRGKGDKERFVFVGSRAFDALMDYLPYRKAKADPVDLDSQQALILNARGKRLTRRGLAVIVEKWVNRQGIQKQVSPHTFRHSFATHVLDGGASIKAVQDLLGHASLSTTQMYTHLGIERLRSIYAAAHPHAGGTSGHGPRKEQKK